MLDGISGEIRPGEVILLRGDNGSGKTTVLNILTGFLAPDAGSIVSRVTGIPACESPGAASPGIPEHPVPRLPHMAGCPPLPLA